jgi:starch-binding outer membrane protein, SusD/RagB family
MITLKTLKTLAALLPLALAACDVKEALLEPQQPAVITPDDIEAAGATGADALRFGALNRLQGWTAGGGSSNQENIVLLADLLTDVWKSGDTFTQRNEADQRRVQLNNAVVQGGYNTIQRSRFWYRDAITALRGSEAGVTDASSKIAEMYFALGYTELHLAEYFCNGIPIGETVAGVPRYTDPLTNQQVFAIALTHLDSAITLASGSTALAVSVRNAAKVAKGRTLVNMGQFAQAAAAVADVPTSFQYTLTYSQTTQSNLIWTINFTQSSARYVVGDSVDTQGTIPNALPFASSNDPRVPVTGSSLDRSRVAIDRSTPWVGQRAWSTRESPNVLASGVDARLIEAEAKIQANDLAGAMTTLNALRTTSQRLGGLTVPAMTALATPTSRDAVITLYFREKAFWQFARGTRLGDMRRLIRQYGRAQDRVFPVGTFFKGTSATYGADVNLPVTDSERSNPNFTGCIDRNA